MYIIRQKKWIEGLSKALIMIIILIGISPVYTMAEGIDDYDIVIKGGTIMNPSTEHELKGYNLAIKDGKIVRITKENITGRKVIDGTGRIISPGFIDLISYEPNDLGIRFKVLDGVTSNLLMHGGTHNAKKWYDYWNNRGVKINYGASSFVTTMRWPIIGYNRYKSITSDEDVQRLVKNVRKNIEEGALGISFSFEYVPGIKSNEVIPLLKLANEYNAPTFYHLRYSDNIEPGTNLEGVQEVIDYARETGASIHIMHINSTGGTYCMEEALKMIHGAIDEGLDITACLYPYDFWATYINSARFDPGWQERFSITYENLQIGGTNERLTEKTFKKYRNTHTLVAALGSMPEEELRMALNDSIIMIGSDTIIEPGSNNHPRGAGTYGRLFGKYVREEGVLTMMEAIKKASYLPAKRMESIAPAMKRKGRIEIGADADITIFNPDTIIDKATVEKPATPSEGIDYVIVNGVIVKDENGIVEGVKPGQPIYSYFVDKSEENEPEEFKIIFEDYIHNIQDAYTISKRLYLPIQFIMKNIDVNVEMEKDGEITIGDNILIEIGNKFGKNRGTDIELNSEPIIYKGNVYIQKEDLVKILEDKYNITFSEKRMEVKKIINEDEINEKKEQHDTNGANKEQKPVDSKKNMLTAMITVLVVSMSGFAYMRGKN